MTELHITHTRKCHVAMNSTQVIGLTGLGAKRNAEAAGDRPLKFLKHIGMGGSFKPHYI